MRIITYEGIIMDNFEENNNLFDFHGTINRRNFMVNILLVETLKQAFVVTPLLIILFLNTDLLKTLYGSRNARMVVCN